MKNRIGATIGLMIFMSLFMSSCYNLGAKITVEKKISFNDVKSIMVDSDSSDITIVPENRNDIYVVFETYKNGEELFVTAGQNTRIETKQPTLHWNLFLNQNYRLIIYVPEEFSGDLSVDLTSGNVEFADFDLADVSIDLTSGNLDFKNISAEKIDIRMTSGDIEVSNVDSESMDIRMTSGNMDLHNFNGKITGHSTSGNVVIAYDDRMDDLSFSCTSGNIEVYYNGIDVNASFELKTTSGNVETEVGMSENVAIKNNKIYGTSGDGTYTVELSLTSGNIKIYK